MSYFYLKQKIDRVNPSTITVDIFDTLLLRKWQPEPWRFYKLAKATSDILNKSGFRTTQMQIFELRNYYSSILRQANLETGFDYETKYEDIVKNIIISLQKRQNINASKNTIKTLVDKIKNNELEFESKQLYLNKKLYKTIIPYLSKGMDIYFVSDMYLSSQDLSFLLKKCGSKLIYKGLSSADELLGKSSSRSFVQLQKKYPKIKLTSTLHIGDNKTGDKLYPFRVGVCTYWLRLPLHIMKLKMGKIIFGSILKTKRYFYTIDRQKKYMRNSGLFELNKTSSTKDTAQRLGWLFAPAIIRYLDFLGTYSTASNSQVAFITSESEVLNQFYEKLGFKGAKKYPQFSRNFMIQAYSSLLSKQFSFNSILAIAKKILRRKTNSSALATLQVSQPGSHKWELVGAKSSRNEIEKLNLDSASKIWQKKYNEALRTWKSISHKSNQKVIIADVGWNDTIQILFHEIIKENKLDSSKLTGKYLGRTGTNIFSSNISTNSQGVIFNSLKSKHNKYLYQPEVWESFLNNDNIDSPTRNDIIDGINQALEYFQKSPLSADTYYQLSSDLLNKTLKKPCKQVIETLASLKFDYGTLDEQICPLVNIGESKIKVYYWLLFKRSKFKNFYFHQGWKWGSANYYNYKFAYRIWRFKTKKPSF